MNVLKLLTISLSLGLTSCKGLKAPSIDDVYRRMVFFEVVGETEDTIIIKKENAQCRLQKYQHSLSYIGPLGEGEDVAFQKCAGTIGYDLYDYKDLAEAKEEIRLKAVQAGIISDD